MHAIKERRRRLNRKKHSSEDEEMSVLNNDSVLSPEEQQEIRFNQKEKQKIKPRLFIESTDSVPISDDRVDCKNKVGNGKDSSHCKKSSICYKEDDEGYEDDFQEQVQYYHGGRVQKVLAIREREGTNPPLTQKLYKISSSSYLHIQWLTDKQLQQRNIQKIQLRSRKPIPILTNYSQKQLSTLIKQSFPQSYTKVDKILSTSVMFPIIYPKKSIQISNSIQQLFVMILQKILNYQQHNIPYGATIQFKSDSHDQLEQFEATLSERELKNKIEATNYRLEHLLSKVYFRKVKSWSQFWNDIGKCLFFLQTRHQGTAQEYDVDALSQFTIFLYWQTYTYFLEKQLKEGQHLNSNIQFIFKDKSISITQAQLSSFLLQKTQNHSLNFSIPQEIQHSDSSSSDNYNNFTYKWLPSRILHQKISKQTNNMIIKFDHIKLLQGQEISKLSIFSEVDQLYLVKWQDLSYVQATWQKQSEIIKSNGEWGQQKIQQFKMFSKLPNKKIRDKLDQYGKFHRQLLKSVNTKKSQTQRISNVNKQRAIMGNSTSDVLIKYKKQNPPIYKNYKMLKQFQLDALNWLIKCYKNGHNCILGDQMGLGKTIQTIAFLQHLSTNQNFTGPFLIVAPVSTLKQWSNQINLWSDFNALMYKGNKAQREIIEEYLFYYKFVNTEGWFVNEPLICKFQIMLMNYQMLVTEFQALQHIPFQYIVVDEAHRVKNHNTKLSQSLKLLPCRRILLLTGTPFQNNPNQLWGLLNFIEPERFRSYEDFKRKFGTLKNIQQVKQLQKLLHPYLLRRVKSDVDQSIPKLSEILVTLQLTRVQKTYYRGILQQNKNNLLSSLQKVQMNNLTFCLRKCCNHPYLLSAQTRKQIQTSQETAYSIQNPGKFIETSCKFQFLKKLLVTQTSITPKTLIFTQFIDTLNILCEFCEIFKISYQFLDGSVPFQQRQNRIENFNYSVHQDVRVFIISTKAGGTGINLTAANCVVIFDSDWNPHNDIQAIARAHRIGQKNAVTVYRLIVGSTYQQVIYTSAIKKLGVGMAVLGNYNSNDDNKNNTQIKNKISEQIVKQIVPPKPRKRGRPKREITSETYSNQEEISPEINIKRNQEIQKLLRDGVLGFLKNQQKHSTYDLQNFTIEEIIANKGKVINYQTKDCSFLKTNFKYTNKNQEQTKQGQLNINDQNFWQVAMKNIQSPLQKLVKKFPEKPTNQLLNSYKNIKEQTELIVQANQIIYGLTRSKIQMKGYNAEDEKEVKHFLYRIVESYVFIEEFKNVVTQWLDEIQKPSRRYQKMKKQQIIELARKRIKREKNKNKKQEINQPTIQPKKQQLFQAILPNIKCESEKKQVEECSSNFYQKLLQNFCSVCQEKRCSKYCTKLCKRTFHSICYDKLKKGEASTSYIKQKEDEASDEQIIQKLKKTFQCFECCLGEVKCFICDKSSEAVQAHKNFRHNKKKKEGQAENNQNKIKTMLSNFSKEDQQKVYQCRFQDCHKFYHLTCLQQIKNELHFEIQQKCKRNETQFYPIKCPIHYCSKCHKKIIGQSATCLRCPISYHQKCKQANNGVSYIQISTDKLICKIHLTEQQLYLQDLLSSEDLVIGKKKQKVLQKRKEKKQKVGEVASKKTIPKADNKPIQSHMISSQQKNIKKLFPNHQENSVQIIE